MATRTLKGNASRAENSISFACQKLPRNYIRLETASTQLRSGRTLASVNLVNLGNLDGARFVRGLA